MARERYSNMNEMATLGFLINALDNRKGGDGDTGASFPRTDAEDMSKGARFILGGVTLARRASKRVNFVTECGPNCWYWEMPDGSRSVNITRAGRPTRSPAHSFFGRNFFCGTINLCVISSE